MTETRSENVHHYEIEILGHLGDSRVQAFDGLELSLTPEGHTIISGKEMDQAALFGVLLRIRDFGSPLLSVVRRDLLLDECAP